MTSDRLHRQIFFQLANPLRVRNSAQLGPARWTQLHAQLDAPLRGLLADQLHGQLYRQLAVTFWSAFRHD